MNTLIRAGIAVLAVGALVIARIAVTTFPEIREPVITAAIVVLSFIALVGLVAPLVLNQGSPRRVTFTAQRPADARSTAVPARHTGGAR